MEKKDFNTDLNEESVNTAFSRQSGIFDTIYENNSITTWMRNRVRKEVLSHISGGASILELNAGTGLDSVFFAKNGFNVLATDNADGMLNRLKEKIDLFQLQDNLTAKKCSFNNLERLEGKQFDYIFSNFGGLNCTGNLAKVLKDMDTLLKPGGHFTLVIMPKVCPWDLLTAFKGYFKTAFRRFKKNGATAHLEGTYFKCYYYNPNYITKVLDKKFKMVSLKGLAIVVPPPYIEDFIEKHPSLFRLFEKIENQIWQKAPYNRWCDHFMITMQKI